MSERYLKLLNNTLIVDAYSIDFVAVSAAKLDRNQFGVAVGTDQVVMEYPFGEETMADTARLIEACGFDISVESGGEQFHVHGEAIEHIQRDQFTITVVHGVCGQIVIEPYPDTIDEFWDLLVEEFCTVKGITNANADQDQPVGE